MPKFGQAWFAGELFGDGKLAPSNFKNSISRAPLGLAVRKVFRCTDWREKHGPKDTSRALIFRVRRGTGYYGSIRGELYQDKYRYFVPSSINNPEGASARTAFATAVYNWKYVLDEATKQEYHRAAVKRGNMSGYNLYVGAYVKANA